MSEMKTLKFPGDTAPREIVDAKAREDITRLSEDILAYGSTVRYDITQTLDNTEKAQARANIGAGTSNFDGRYSALTGKPTIPTKTSDLTNDSGFGTYSKPADGIPKADLAEAVQTSLSKADTALQTHQSLAAYRTAAEQDVIDNTKLTDAPTDGKEYARKNGNWHEITSAVESVNGKTGVVALNATEIPSTKLSPADTISFVIAGAFDENLVELTRNGAPASANDFISAINSGSTVTVSLHDQGNPKVTFKDAPVKYKITGDTLSLCFIAEKGHTYTPAIYVLSGPTSGTGVSNLVEHRFTDSLYQENYVSANDLPVQAPLSVEEYLEELESSVDTLQPKLITDSGGYFHTDTVEGALQEIGAELAGINTLLGSGIQISFIIEDTTCTADAGQTFSEWVGSGYKTIANGMVLSVHPYSDEGVIFLDEAGVYALSLDGNTPVRGGDRIISGTTYVAMNWGG